MKFVKKIFVLSNGSLYFCYELVTNSNELVTLKLEDEKNFFLNKKKKVSKFDYKYYLKYKKKYF
jgi:hypothetical protein